jgi:hypothetical protein
MVKRSSKSIFVLQFGDGLYQLEKNREPRGSQADPAFFVKMNSKMGHPLQAAWRVLQMEYNLRIIDTQIISYSKPKLKELIKDTSDQLDTMFVTSWETMTAIWFNMKFIECILYDTLYI